MIALNAPQTGRMMSTNGADEMCWRQAHAANLTGEFTAFISNRFQHVYTIVPIRNRNLPVGNLQVRTTKVTIIMIVIYSMTKSQLEPNSRILIG